MNRDEAFQQLKIAVQDPNRGPRKISELADSGFDLNHSTDPKHPIFLAIALHHFKIVTHLLKNGVRFDHRDPGYYNASVIQRLRSLRNFFAGLVKSPDHKASRNIIKTRFKAVEESLAIYDAQIASGQIEEIPDSPEPTLEESLAAIQKRLEGKE
jgi:hypothetical protein